MPSYISFNKQPWCMSREKDTKNSRTWWCFIAPMRPARATKNRKTPTPMMPPTTWKLDTNPNHFPHAAIPIINRLTICRTDIQSESAIYHKIMICNICNPSSYRDTPPNWNIQHNIQLLKNMKCKCLKCRHTNMMLWLWSYYITQIWLIDLKSLTEYLHYKLGLSVCSFTRQRGFNEKEIVGLSMFGAWPI